HRSFLKTDGPRLPDSGIAGGNEDYGDGEDEQLNRRGTPVPSQPPHSDGNEDCSRRQNLNAVAHVVVGKRPPGWDEDRYASVGNREGIERKRQPQQQERPKSPGDECDSDASQRQRNPQQLQLTAR